MLRLPGPCGYAAQELISINAESARSTDMVLKIETTVPVQEADPTKVRLFVGGKAQIGGTGPPPTRRKVDSQAWISSPRCAAGRAWGLKH
jgi:hypothetical protein